MTFDSSSTKGRFDSIRFGRPSLCGFIRVALFLCFVLVLCPIRYWPLESGIDPTWRFAVNYAHASGIEIVFMNGPLGYLAFPQNIGNNLSEALLFQAGVWLVLIFIAADVFFRSGFPVRNLALLSFCFSLAAPLFWFNYNGLENLLEAGVLLLLARFRHVGSPVRLIVALVLVGLLPFFKLTAGLIGASMLAGMLVDLTLREGRKALPTILLTIAVPLSVATGICLRFMPSVPAVLRYLRGSFEIISGYTSAMSLPVEGLEVAAAVEAAVVLAVLLWLHSRGNSGDAGFCALVLIIPLLISFKHGFVRQDEHTVNFFCFVALSMALVALKVDLRGAGANRVIPLIFIFLIIWQYRVNPRPRSFLQATGVDAASMFWGSLPYDKLKRRLDASTGPYPEVARIESSLLTLIGDSPVTSLSINYTSLAAAHKNLKLLPVLQRITAYTPFLDRLSAAWIRDKGPRFLVFDGQTIDGRDAWAETPAIWLEVYRWYNTRGTGPHNLLLERRVEPRFAGLEPIGSFRVPFPGAMPLPPSSADLNAEHLFWTAECTYSASGRFTKLLFQNAAVSISVSDESGTARHARVIPEVLVSPVPGNFLPGNLKEFAAVFDASDRFFHTNRIAFEDSGSRAWEKTCDGKWFRAVR